MHKGYRGTDGIYAGRGFRALALLVSVAALLGLVGCNQTGLSQAEPTIQAQKAAANDNSMQAIKEARLAREELPGKTHYQRACATCHEGQVKKAPHREMLGLMTPEAILGTLTGGLMQMQGAALSEDQQKQVAEYLGGRALGNAQSADLPKCDADQQLDLQKPIAAKNWGLNLTNDRAVNAEQAGVDGSSVASLEPAWAVAFPGANRARSQPLLAGGLMFVGSHGGSVYALDEASGCQVWRYEAAAEVRTGFALSQWEPGNQAKPGLYFGDVLGNVYRLDASSGEESFRVRADEHPNATITATPSLLDDTLYVPVSSLEVSLAVDPAYPCCTFRGSVVALDAVTGEERWKTYTIEETPAEQSKNSAGTPMMGPSGAVVWNSPSIDVARGQLYVGTGENMSSPATLTSDAIIALDLQTGAVRWSFQATANDVWNTACDTDQPASCPPENGPDFDFGAATILAAGRDGRELVLAGQKSGFVHALDPDSGKLVWQTRVGRGGIQGGVHFGMAAANGQLFVPITDMADGREYDNPARPGLHALDISSGKLQWYTPAPDVCAGRASCHPGFSQAISTAGGLVYAGGMDGVLRVYRAQDGEELFELDATKDFKSLTGEQASGGSFGGAAGPIVSNGRVYISSGYGIYNHMTGNLLLALEIDE